MKKSSAEILAESKKKLDLALQNKSTLQEDFRWTKLFGGTAGLVGFGIGTLLGGPVLGTIASGIVGAIFGRSRDRKDESKVKADIHRNLEATLSKIKELFDKNGIPDRWQRTKSTSNNGVLLRYEFDEGRQGANGVLFIALKFDYSTNFGSSDAKLTRASANWGFDSSEIGEPIGREDVSIPELLKNLEWILKHFKKGMDVKSDSVLDAAKAFESRKQKSKKSIFEGKKPRITKEFRQVVAGIAQKNGFNSIVEYSDAESAIIKIVKKDKEYFTTKIEITGDKVKLSFEGDGAPNPITGKVSEWVSVGEGWRDLKTLFAVKNPSVIQRYAKHLNEKLKSLKESKAIKESKRKYRKYADAEKEAFNEIGMAFVEAGLKRITNIFNKNLKTANGGQDCFKKSSYIFASGSAITIYEFLINGHSGMVYVDIDALHNGRDWVEYLVAEVSYANKNGGNWSNKITLGINNDLPNSRGTAIVSGIKEKARTPEQCAEEIIRRLRQINTSSNQ
jgi:hypothetical protein